MKAIQVKYLPATTHRSSRWKAFAEGGLSSVMPYDHSGSEYYNARCAAQRLIEKMKWRVEISGDGNLPNGDYVFTLRAVTTLRDLMEKDREAAAIAESR